MTFPEESKRNRFATIISPLKAGINASAEEENAAVPAIEGTIPIYADFVMGAGIIDTGSPAAWKIGGDGAVKSKADRKVYLHLPIAKVGAKVRLGEGDGAFVSDVKAGDELLVESIGEGRAEVVVLDSN